MSLSFWALGISSWPVLRTGCPKLRLDQTGGLEPQNQESPSEKTTCPEVPKTFQRSRRMRTDLGNGNDKRQRLWPFVAIGSSLWKDVSCADAA